MIEFIQNNYLVILSVVILIVCAIIGLIADGKLFRKNKDKQENAVASNPEISNDNTLSSETSVNATEEIIAPAVEQSTTEENVELPEELYTPIEEVKPLNDVQPNDVVEVSADSSAEVVVAPTVEVETPVVEQTIEPTVEEKPDEQIEVISFSEPVEPTAEPVVSSPVIEETPVQQNDEEINFGDINTFDEAETIDDVTVTEPIGTVNEAPTIDEVTVVPQPVETISDDDTTTIVEDDVNTIVDESAFFNPRSYEDASSLEEEEEKIAEPVVSEEPEILDFSIDEIEDVVEPAVEPTVEQIVEPTVEEKPDEQIEVISFSEPVETLDNITPDEEVTSQEFDTTENASETSEDDDWKF